MADLTRRKLVLLRHAKSAWPDVPDHERPLARRGQRDAPVMGRWLRAAGYLPDQVLCSTARRARETWQLVQAGLGSAPPASCYAVNDHPSGPCDVCGEPVEAPAGLSWTGSLIWALRHPDGDRALLAARTLGRLRARESVPALRQAVKAGNDVYLRAAALRSLIAIEGAEPRRGRIRR